jgi:cytochrome c peroxidase
MLFSRKMVPKSLVLVLISLLMCGPMLSGFGYAQGTDITTPDDARLVGLESLRLALQNDGGVPLPNSLQRVVTDRDAAILLGKALFWDMQVGSDGIQSCASCHFHAGADNREKNQLNPDILRIENVRDEGDFPDVVGFFNAAADPDNLFEIGGPNYTLLRGDFPFVRDIGTSGQNGQNVNIVGNTVEPAAGNSNDVGSSQGVFLTLFNGVIPGSAVDDGTPQLDPVWNVDDITVRRVEPRNTPTTINAVLNFTNFWDGRANHNFNGENPFGRQDRDARIFVRRGRNLQEQRVSLNNASLASQAVGPPLSFFEMSFGDGGTNFRTWPEIGKKMLSLDPLAQQLVDPTDGVLGPYSNSPANGINVSYSSLIQQAFRNNLWDSPEIVAFAGATLAPGPGNQFAVTNGRSAILPRSLETLALENGVETFSQMEANFAFFFGVAVMLYEATLISDQSPFDVWMEGDGTSVPGFDTQELAGLNVFVNEGKCVNCHGGPEFTNASVRNAQAGNNVIEPMIMGDNNPALYDNGFYNIGVTPTVEDMGRGGADPFGAPLAFSRQFAFSLLGIQQIRFPIIGANQGLVCDPADCESGVLGVIEPDTAEFIPVCNDTDGDGGCDDLILQRITTDGAFKTPTVRNVELTGPFMHNGSLATLLEVVEFYDRGGNFCRFNNVDLDPDIQGIGFTPEQEAALVAFMVSLTDPRVKFEAAPFDHPELRIPNGHPGDDVAVTENASVPGQAEDDIRTLNAVGAAGVAPGNELQPFLNADQMTANAVAGGVCSPNFPTP